MMSSPAQGAKAQTNGAPSSRAGGGRLPPGLTAEAQKRGPRAAAIARAQKSVAKRLIDLAHDTHGAFSAATAIRVLKAKPATVVKTLSELKIDGFLVRVGVEKGLEARFALSEEMRTREPRVPPVFSKRSIVHLEGATLPEPARVRRELPHQHLTPEAFFADKPPLPANRFVALNERGGRCAMQ